MVESLGERLGNVLDGGSCDIGVESTILDFQKPDNARVLRMGPISLEEIQNTLGDSVEIAPNILDSQNQKEGLIAPGTLTKHYSPNTQLHLVPNGFNADDLANQTHTEGAAVLFFKRPSHTNLSDGKSYWLTESGKLSDAAHNLFHLLREVDKQNFQIVYVEQAPSGGLGDTINDRLKRAAANS